MLSPLCDSQGMDAVDKKLLGKGPMRGARHQQAMYLGPTVLPNALLAVHPANRRPSGLPCSK